MKMHRLVSRWALARSLIIVLSFTAISVFGLGVRIPNQDAEAIARGNAFVATADNPSALYYNPAGITQLQGQHLQVGLLNYLGITSQYESPLGRHAETKFEIQPVPQVNYVYTPQDFPLSLGLGLYCPYGLGLEWPRDTGFSTLAIEGRLFYLTLNPTVAWQIIPSLSLAAGPTFNYSDIRLRNAIGFLPNDEFRFKGDDFNFGYHLGLLWRPHEKWAFGASYRSGTSMNYEGHSIQEPFATSVATSARLDFPQNASAGISFRPTPNWNFEADVDWTDWSSVDVVTFNGAINPLSGQNIALPLFWHSSWFYHLGGTYYFPNGWFASAGYFFSENSTSEKHFTPIVPDTDLHVGSLGGGRHGKHWDWALAGQIITGPWRNIEHSESTSLVGQSADGRYRFIVPAVTFSVGYHF